MLKNIEDKGAKVIEADKQLLGILKCTNRNRLIITTVVLVTFMLIMIGIGVALFSEAGMGAEWKEILLLVLGAFIASYGKIIDFWFQKQDTDAALIQAVDSPDPAPVDDSMGGDSCSVCGKGVPSPGDVDGDGIPNYLDEDSDNDGIPDYLDNIDESNLAPVGDSGDVVQTAAGTTVVLGDTAFSSGNNEVGIDESDVGSADADWDYLGLSLIHI